MEVVTFDHLVVPSCLGLGLGKPFQHWGLVAGFRKAVLTSVPVGRCRTDTGATGAAVPIPPAVPPAQLASEPARVTVTFPDLEFWRPLFLLQTETLLCCTNIIFSTLMNRDWS